MKLNAPGDSKVGIDHVAVYVPDQCLPMASLAKNRNIPLQKLTAGYGCREMAVASPCEDVVAMAANAGHKVLIEADISPDEVGLLIVGTESTVDRSKPVATLVHGLLGINNRCRVYDVTHACIGASYGVVSAIDWLNGTSGKYALVIGTDIALYEKGTTSEPTQGAGAVAMLLSQNPRLLALEEVGRFSKSVYDFWKPLELDYPQVDGKYSGQCYINAVEACFCEVGSIDMDAAFMYHTPFPKLIKHAHEKVCSLSGYKEWQQHFNAKVDLSLSYARRVGNIYTGSLWLGLASFLGLGKEVKTHAGCYLFSYGSGCGALLLRGDFTQMPETLLGKLDLSERLDSRVQLDCDEYEALRGAIVSKDDRCSGRFSFVGVENYKRKYVDSHIAKQL